MKLNVFYLLKQQNDDGRYEEDPDSEYGREFYIEPTWSTSFFCEQFEAHNIKEAFDEEDGDYDFHKHIAVITDHNDRLLFSDRWSLDSQRIAKEKLLEVQENE